METTSSPESIVGAAGSRCWRQNTAKIIIILDSFNWHAPTSIVHILRMAQISEKGDKSPWPSNNCLSATSPTADWRRWWELNISSLKSGNWRKEFGQFLVQDDLFKGGGIFQHYLDLKQCVQFRACSKPSLLAMALQSPWSCIGWECHMPLGPALGLHEGSVGLQLIIVSVDEMCTWNLTWQDGWF